MGEITLDMREVNQQITVDVKLVNLRMWRWRSIVGLWFLRMGARIMWMSIEFETEDGAQET